MTKKLKIYITQVGHPDFRGGGNTVAHNLSQTFAKRGHTVTTIFLSPKNLLLKRPKTAYNMVLKKASIIPIINCLKIAIVVKKLSNNKDKNPDVIIVLAMKVFLFLLLKENQCLLPLLIILYET